MMYLTMTMANLLEKGWPAPAQRPGLFILIGTSGFTIVALIGMARAAPSGYGYFERNPIAADVLLIVATWVGVFLWLFSFWAFGLAFMINVLELFVKRNGTWHVNLPYTNTAWGKFCRLRLANNKRK
jgi:tellurite resistance protein TehA-like permease